MPTPGLGGGLGGGAGNPMAGLAGLLNNSPPPPTSPVTEIENLAHLERIIAETPAVIIDFWSPTCPPCMRIKPTFEAVAKANDVRKFLFFNYLVRESAACFSQHTTSARCCAQV